MQVERGDETEYGPRHARGDGDEVRLRGRGFGEREDATGDLDERSRIPRRIEPPRMNARREDVPRARRSAALCHEFAGVELPLSG